MASSPQFPTYHPYATTDYAAQLSSYESESAKNTTATRQCYAKVAVGVICAVAYYAFAAQITALYAAKVAAPVALKAAAVLHPYAFTALSNVYFAVQWVTYAGAIGGFMHKMQAWIGVAIPKLWQEARTLKHKVEKLGAVNTLISTYNAEKDRIEHMLESATERLGNIITSETNTTADLLIPLAALISQQTTEIERLNESKKEITKQAEETLNAAGEKHTELQAQYSNTQTEAKDKVRKEYDEYVQSVEKQTRQRILCIDTKLLVLRTKRLYMQCVLLNPTTMTKTFEEVANFRCVNVQYLSVDDVNMEDKVDEVEYNREGEIFLQLINSESATFSKLEKILNAIESEEAIEGDNEGFLSELVRLGKVDVS